MSMDSSSQSGTFPNTKPFCGQLDLDRDDYIVSHGGARTNIPGVSFTPAMSRIVPIGRRLPQLVQAAWQPLKWNGI